MSTHSSDTFGAQFTWLGGPAPKRRQIVLVPGAEVPLLALDLPPKLHGQAREQVARRQLQDRVGLSETTVEMRPFQLADAKENAKSWSRVLIADTARMQGWRQKAGGKCKAILPDYLALPAAPDVWTLTQTPQGISVRLGVEDGFSANDDVALAMLEQALVDAPPKVVLRLGAALPQIEAALNAQDIPVVTSINALGDHDVSAPQILGHGELSLDLRRDPQLARTRIRKQALPWRWPLLIGAIAAGLWGYAQHLETSRITQATRDIRIQTQAAVKEHFVTIGPVLDVRAQVSRALAAQKQATATQQLQSSAFDFLARASGVIAQESAVPEQFSAVTAQEVLIVLRVADFAAADQMAAALDAAGLAVEVVESRVSDTDSGVRTEIRLRDAQVPQ